MLDIHPLIIENSQVTTSFSASPDRSVNVEQLNLHSEKYPDRWKVAFDYLNKMDITRLVLGRINLSEEVYVSVTEYETKKVDESCYESHKKYIDIQYVLSGQEYIAVNKNIPWLKIISPYNEEMDFLNYEYDGQKLLLANQKHFFVFFPTDAHMPCIKVAKKSSVKKLVIKVKYN